MSMRLTRARRILPAAAWLAAAALAVPATAAEDFSLTFFGGFRDGGTFIDAGTDEDIGIEGSTSFAAAMEFPLDAKRRLQFLFSFQDTALDLSPPPGAPPGSATDFPMKVMYLHVGGPVFFAGDTSHGAYVVGGLGATLFSPSGDYDDELRASANLGIGYQQPLGEHFAMRIEARGYFTLVNSSGGMFCSGGCVVAIRGEGTIQGEVSIGLVFRP